MKTFLLGLGAQKSGTTWLYQQLRANDNVDMGFIKEYHVLDGLSLPHTTAKLKRRLLNLPPPPGDDADHGTLLEHLRSQEFLWLSLYSRPGAYYDFFASLLRQDGIMLTGDMTPSYSALSAETLRQAVAAFQDRNIRVVCVFLMRDPVERLWSAIRMQHKLARNRNPDVGHAPSEDKAVLYAMDRQKARLRGNYHATLKAIEAVFAPEDRFVGLYESFLKDPSEWDRFTAMLDVPLLAPDYELHPNATAKSRELEEATMRQVAQTYGETYDYVRRAYPHLDIDAHWSSVKYL